MRHQEADVISSAWASQDPNLGSAVEATDTGQVGEVEAELSLALQRDGRAGREDRPHAVQRAFKMKLRYNFN